MDGTVEAHNISFGCGHLAINITLPHDWNHFKNQDFEQRSERNGGGVVSPYQPIFLSSLIKSPLSSSILPAQSDTRLSCF